MDGRVRQALGNRPLLFSASCQETRPGLTEVLADFSPLHSCKEETTPSSPALAAYGTVQFFQVSTTGKSQKPGDTEGRGSFLLLPYLPIYLFPLLVCLYTEGHIKEQMFPAGDVRLPLTCAMYQGWNLKFPGTLSICNWLLSPRGA